MKCSALNVDFNRVSFDPLGSSSSPYECIKFGYPLQNARFLLLLSSLSRELAAHHKKHCWRAFRGYQHRWFWTTLNPKIGFSDFFRALRRPHAFQEWTALTSLEIDQDNMQIQFSALNVDFNNASFDPLGTRRPPYERIKFGYPLKTCDFCYCRLI